MKKSKLHKIKVQNRPGSEGMLTNGSNTQVLLDGKLLKFAKSFKFEVEAGSISKVTIELYAEVELDIHTEPMELSKESTDLKFGDKPVKLYTLSDYFPKTVDTEGKE